MNSNSPLQRQRRQDLGALHVSGATTQDARAASPPFATRMLFRPAPANVALIAIQSDGAPTGRRNTHQRTPLSTSDNMFTAAAANSSTVRLALCDPRHVLAN